MNLLKKNVPGLLLCLVIAVPSWFLGQALPVIGGPVFAILIGMTLTLILTRKEIFAEGINYTSKKILQAAVVFLGFGMNLTEILAKGKQSLPIIISTITTSLVIAFILYKALKLRANNAVLVGVGSSICGGSAIAATAPVIGASDEEVAQSISVIFLFNVLAALIFPTLGGMLGLSNEGFGLFAGTAINDTSSVTAAATAWDGIHGSNTLDAAAIVKMTRTLAIIPITLVLAIYRGKKEKSSKGSSFSLKKSFPYFVLFFILASVITTFFQLPAAVTAPLKGLSKFLIVMAMAVWLAGGIHAADSGLTAWRTSAAPTLESPGWQSVRSETLQPVDTEGFWSPFERRSGMTGKVLEPGRVQLMWSPDALYVRCRLTDSDLVASPQNRDQSAIYMAADAVELFLKCDDSPCYWEFHGSIDGKKSGWRYSSRGRLGLPGTDVRSAVTVTVQEEGTRNHLGDRDANWQILFRVDAEELRRGSGCPWPGERRWRMQLVRYN